jgi:hypothetical protein
LKPNSISGAADAAQRKSVREINKKLKDSAISPDVVGRLAKTFLKIKTAI